MQGKSLQILHQKKIRNWKSLFLVYKLYLELHLHHTVHCLFIYFIFSTDMCKQLYNMQSHSLLQATLVELPATFLNSATNITVPLVSSPSLESKPLPGSGSGQDNISVGTIKLCIPAANFSRIINTCKLYSLSHWEQEKMVLVRLSEREDMFNKMSCMSFLLQLSCLQGEFGYGFIADHLLNTVTSLYLVPRIPLALIITNMVSLLRSVGFITQCGKL